MANSTISGNLAREPCPLLDQTGRLRPIDGGRDGIAACDIGAVEFKPARPLFR